MNTEPKDLPSELRLSLDWELWIVEQLLFTAKLDDLTALLATQGVPPDLAHTKIQEILHAPSFQRLQARLGEATLAARLQRLQQALPLPGIEARDHIDPDALLKDHWIASRPLLLTEAMRATRAVQHWTFDWLAQQFPDAEVEVNIQRTSATRAKDTERLSQQWPLPTLIERIQAAPSNAFYVVSRNGLLSLPAFRPLWDDFTPLPPILIPTTPPRGVSLWIGPAGTITPPHFDPHNVLLVQVQGRKRVRLAPRLTAALHHHLDGYYLNAPLDAVFPSQILEATLEPGQALFIPVGWFHEVTALDPSITLSFLNFPWENHFHWIGPPGSDDAR
jgi:hypothetical protein